METQESTFVASYLRADQFIAGQRHSPRRIAKHLSRAGFAAAGVITPDVNFIEDAKNANRGVFLNQ